MAESVLALRDILVRHGETAVLRVADLAIARGEVLALLGPNGAGKSTLLRVMGLLQRPDEGSVSFCGVEAQRRSSLALRRRIAVVFQEPLLLNESVYRNTALGLRLRGVNQLESERRIRPWLERFGIAHLSSRPARSLSGGEAQRTSLARGFAIEPELLLLDEPFSALDPASREALLGDFHRIVKESKTTTVLVSHDRRECFGLADRIAVLQAGQLLQLAAPEKVFFQPATESVAEIVGSENRLRGTVRSHDGQLSVIDLSVTQVYAAGQFRAGAKVIVCIRPEEISLACGPRPVEWQNLLSGEVLAIQPGIETQRIVLNCGSLKLIALIRRSSLSEMKLAVGNEIRIGFSASAVHVIESAGD